MDLIKLGDMYMIELRDYSSALGYFMKALDESYQINIIQIEERLHQCFHDILLMSNEIKFKAYDKYITIDNKIKRLCFSIPMFTIFNENVETYVKYIYPYYLH
jgi:hypothetical protein